MKIERYVVRHVDGEFHPAFVRKDGSVFSTVRDGNWEMAWIMAASVDCGISTISSLRPKPETVQKIFARIFYLMDNNWEVYLVLIDNDGKVTSKVSVGRQRDRMRNMEHHWNMLAQQGTIALPNGLIWMFLAVLVVIVVLLIA